MKLPNLTSLTSWFSGVQTYITIGLLVATLAASAGWYVTGLRLDACKAGRTADRASYHQAQAEATTLAIIAKAAEEKRNEERRQKADEDYRALSAKYHDALGLYKAAQRKASNSNLPGEAPAPESPNGPGQSPELFAVTGEDLDICVENTARLESAVEWIKSLVTTTTEPPTRTSSLSGDNAPSAEIATLSTTTK